MHVNKRASRRQKTNTLFQQSSKVSCLLYCVWTILRVSVFYFASEPAVITEAEHSVAQMPYLSSGNHTCKKLLEAEKIPQQTREHFTSPTTHIICTMTLNWGRVMVQESSQILMNATLQSKLKTHCEKQQRPVNYSRLTKHPGLSVPQKFTKAKHYSPRRIKCWHVYMPYALQ